MIDFERMRMLIRQVPKCCFAIEQARSRAEGTQSQVISDMPRGGGGRGDKMAMDVIDLDELESAWAEAVQELSAMRAELAPLIDRLDNAKERGVMRLRYMSGYSLDEIVRDTNLALPRTTVHRCLEIAEDKIKKMQAGT